MCCRLLIKIYAFQKAWSCTLTKDLLVLVSCQKVAAPGMENAVVDSSTFSPPPRAFFFNAPSRKVFQASGAKTFCLLGWKMLLFTQGHFPIQPDRLFHSPHVMKFF
jgi:hypothetical protein